MKIAIIGAGIVGSTAAYYLSKIDAQVDVYDHGVGQATKAAAGIISPWFSKRRNKAWYRMARLGADFYQELVADLERDGVDTSFYQQTGVYLLKKNEEKLAELYDIASGRREESPLIGDLEILDAAAVASQFPGLENFNRLIFASGGAHVEGALLTKTLLEASGLPLYEKEVTVEKTAQGYRVDGREYDKVILAVGAWLPNILQPLGYEVDVRPQKGQLRDYQTSAKTDDYPVVMPEGELDLIPFSGGKISVGASHENDMGYDLDVDLDIIESMETEALTYLPTLAHAEVLGERVGTRAYTTDFSPFYGGIDGEDIFVASGLGSSGLTTGPLIGFDLARLAMGETTRLTVSDYPVERYVKRV